MPHFKTFNHFNFYKIPQDYIVSCPTKSDKNLGPTLSIFIEDNVENLPPMSKINLQECQSSQSRNYLLSKEAMLLNEEIDEIQDLEMNGVRMQDSVLTINNFECSPQVIKDEVNNKLVHRYNLINVGRDETEFEGTLISAIVDCEYPIDSPREHTPQVLSVTEEDTEAEIEIENSKVRPMLIESEVINVKDDSDYGDLENNAIDVLYPSYIDEIKNTIEAHLVDATDKKSSEPRLISKINDVKASRPTILNLEPVIMQEFDIHALDLDETPKDSEQINELAEDLNIKINQGLDNENLREQEKDSMTMLLVVISLISLGLVLIIAIGFQRFDYDVEPLNDKV